MVIIGDKELDDNNLSVRDRSGNDLGSMNFDKFAEILKELN